MLFGGDNMGKWYCGDNLRDEVLLREFQTKLSKDLGRFAEEVRKKYWYYPRKARIYWREDFLGLLT